MDCLSSHFDIHHWSLELILFLVDLRGLKDDAVWKAPKQLVALKSSRIVNPHHSLVNLVGFFLGARLCLGLSLESFFEVFGQGKG